MHGYPVIIPSPGESGVGYPSLSRIAKCVITADTTLSTDSYDILLNDSADADTDADIPCFVFPSGTIIEDIGFEIFMVFTESAAFKFGDTSDSDGWASTVTLVATDTDAAGRIRWMSQYTPNTYAVGVGSTVAPETCPAFIPAYLEWGPRAMYGASDATGSTVTGLDSDTFDLLRSQHHINFYQDGAVAVTGAMSVFLKYNFANLYKMAPSTNLGIFD